MSKLWAIVGGLMAGLFLTGHALAATNWGRMCWNTEYDDKAVAWVTRNPEDPRMFAIPVMEWTGPPEYRLMGTGAVVLAYPETGRYHLNAKLEQRTTYFLNNPSCTLDAVLDPKKLSGPGRMTCKGGIDTSGEPLPEFTHAVTLTKAACPPLKDKERE